MSQHCLYIIRYLCLGKCVELCVSEHKWSLFWSLTFERHHEEKISTEIWDLLSRDSGWGKESSQLGQMEPSFLVWTGQKGHFKLHLVTGSSKPFVTFKQGALFLAAFWTLQMSSDVADAWAHRDHSRNRLVTTSTTWQNRNLLLRCCDILPRPIWILWGDF